MARSSGYSQGHVTILSTVSVHKSLIYSSLFTVNDSNDTTQLNNEEKNNKGMHISLERMK